MIVLNTIDPPPNAIADAMDVAQITFALQAHAISLHFGFTDEMSIGAFSLTNIPSPEITLYLKCRDVPTI